MSENVGISVVGFRKESRIVEENTPKVVKRTRKSSSLSGTERGEKWEIRGKKFCFTFRTY